MGHIVGRVCNSEFSDFFASSKMCFIYITSLVTKLFLVSPRLYCGLIPKLFLVSPRLYCGLIPKLQTCQLSWTLSHKIAAHLKVSRGKIVNVRRNSATQDVVPFCCTKT